MESKKYRFNEMTAMQLSQALRGALREPSPLKLTVAKCAKVMENAVSHYLEAKDAVMEKIAVKKEDGTFALREGKEGPPEIITDFKLSISDEEAIKEFEQISDSEIEVTLPTISAETEVMLGGKVVTLEKFLDMDPTASGNLAYVYLVLTENGQ
jgi:hypothetical protein|tara:strand:+ start:154 stop:615 length:462 start_codon:yes stop_codon:yes gene_type:complete